MTTREHLNKHRKWSLLAVCSVIPIWIGAVFPVVFLGKNDPCVPLMIIGFLVSLCGWFAFVLGGRCLQCGQRLNVIFFYRGSLLKISKLFHFCPYCGKSLDEESAKEQDPSNHSTKG